MASERLCSAQDLLDLTFQSLAMQHMDLKQVELDTAVAKVDELSRQLVSLWTDGPGPPKEPHSPSQPRSPLAQRRPESPELPGDVLGCPGSPRAPHYLPAEDRAPSPRPKVLAVPSPGGRAPSPRPPPYEFLGFGGSPRPGEGSVFFPRPPPYEVHALYPSIGAAARAQDDLVLKRRPQKSWNESNLDVTYEKKPSGSGGYDRTSEGHLGLRPALAPWRESSLDGAGGGSKDGAYGGHSATLPRNYKVSPLAGRATRGGTPRRPPPRAWPCPQHPVSRIPVPPRPAGPPPPRHKPLPLSVIFTQNAFWAGGGGPRGVPLGLSAVPRVPQKQPQLPALPQGPPALPWGEAPGRPVPPDPPVAEGEPELERLLQGGGEAEGLERPLSPTRLQPLLPPEARGVPEFQEVARVLAEMPRPLKRRGSMEQSPGPSLPPSRRRYRQLIPRLLHRPPAPPDPDLPPPPPPPPPPSPWSRDAATPPAAAPRQPSAHP
ncbi:LOW QUALITY PROTEIN: relA-associated inhibitor, partial [Podargus strigoides]